MPYPKGNILKPVALTPEVQQAIIVSLTKGNYLNTACESSGVTRWTFYHWKNRFDEGDPDAQIYADFFNSIKRASAIGEALALERLQTGSTGWQAYAWFLERRFPARWGRKDQLTVKGKDVKKLTDEELEAIAEGKG
jgi:hypothetical protein